MFFMQAEKPWIFFMKTEKRKKKWNNNFKSEKRIIPLLLRLNNLGNLNQLDIPFMWILIRIYSLVGFSLLYSRRWGLWPMGLKLFSFNKKIMQVLFWLIGCKEEESSNVLLDSLSPTWQFFFRKHHSLSIHWVWMVTSSGSTKLLEWFIWQWVEQSYNRLEYAAQQSLVIIQPGLMYFWMRGIKVSLLFHYNGINSNIWKEP